jgi:hypothetical protein
MVVSESSDGAQSTDHQNVGHSETFRGGSACLYVYHPLTEPLLGLNRGEALD